MTDANDPGRPAPGPQPPPRVPLTPITLTPPPRSSSQPARPPLTAAQLGRACGALVGVGVGDALGAGYEFGSALLEGPPQMIGGGLGGFAPGEWTDDTAQSFLVARVAAVGIDLREPAALDAIALGFAEWFAADPPDVGSQTRAVMTAAGPRPSAKELVAVAAALHRRTRRTAGNGSLMRTVPVALAYLHDPDGLVDASVRVSALTHADPVAGAACALWGLAIRDAVLTGELGGPRAGLRFLPAYWQAFWTGRIDEAEANPPGVFAPNGYVVTAFQAAWSSIFHTAVPPEPGDDETGSPHLSACLDTVITVGHDTDTIASIAGGLLGARYGLAGLPARWRAILHGWPGGTTRDLTRMAALIVSGGLA